jgi:hypothetical protein
LMSGHHLSISAICHAPSASGVCRSRGKVYMPRACSAPIESEGIPLEQ